jgi:hypothetical protein
VLTSQDKLVDGPIEASLELRTSLRVLVLGSNEATLEELRK